jgi:hypothetical protein
MFIPFELKCKRTRKKGKFAIYIDEQGRSAHYIKKLKHLLKDDYPFLLEESRVYREKGLGAVKPGDYVLVGFDKRGKYDYTTISVDTWLEDDSISDRVLVLSLQEHGLKTIKKAIKRYVQKNFPHKTRVKKRKCCVAVQPAAQVTIHKTVTRPTCPLTVVKQVQPVQTRRVVKVVERPKRNWTAQVNKDYVLLTRGGRYDIRKITKYGGRESVSIDGTRYTVRRDYAGRGILL